MRQKLLRLPSSRRPCRGLVAGDPTGADADLVCRIEKLEMPPCPPIPESLALYATGDWRVPEWTPDWKALPDPAEHPESAELYETLADWLRIRGSWLEARGEILLQPCALRAPAGSEGPSLRVEPSRRVRDRHGRLHVEPRRHAREEPRALAAPRAAARHRARLEPPQPARDRSAQKRRRGPEAPCRNPRALCRGRHRPQGRLAL
ncbi:MAG: hypothetical protein ACLUNV_11340 [Sutterella wadsworthensis]